MAIAHEAKYKALQYCITDFAIEVGIKADKEKYNKAWHKLWCRIDKLRLFSPKKTIL
jgi:hypothetical protein